MKTLLFLFTAIICCFQLGAQPEVIIEEAKELDNRLWVNIKITADGNTLYKGGILTEEDWQPAYRYSKNIKAEVSKAIRLLPQEDFFLILKFTVGRNTFSNTVSSWKPTFQEYIREVAVMKNPPFEIVDAIPNENSDSVKALEIEAVKDTTEVEQVKLQKIESSGRQEKVRLQKRKEERLAPKQMEKKQ